MREVKKGSTDITVYFHLRDSSDGTSKTGLLYSSAGAVASYVRNGAARTAITLATLASASAAHSDGGFILVDDTNAKGLYRLDIPDAAFLTGVDGVVIHIGFTGVFEESIEIVLVDNIAKDNYDRIGAAGASLTDLGGMSTGMKGEVNAEADTAISDAALATAASLTTHDGKLDTANTHLTDIKGTGFTKDTHSLPQCLTATGFSTHSAADVWSVATRVLTAGTNIVLAKGTGVTGFNDLSAAEINAECDTALTDYGALKGGTAMTEGYAADGATATPEQMLYMIWSAVSEFAISGTTLTCKELDGSTASMTFTLDSGTDPTSRTRAA